MKHFFAPFELFLCVVLCSLLSTNQALGQCDIPIREASSGDHGRKCEGELANLTAQIIFFGSGGYGDWVFVWENNPTQYLYASASYTVNYYSDVKLPAIKGKKYWVYAYNRDSSSAPAGSCNKTDTLWLEYRYIDPPKESHIKLEADKQIICFDDLDNTLINIKATNLYDNTGKRTDKLRGLKLFIKEPTASQCECSNLNEHRFYTDTCSQPVDQYMMDHSPFWFGYRYSQPDSLATIDFNDFWGYGFSPSQLKNTIISADLDTFWICVGAVKARSLPNSRLDFDYNLGNCEYIKPIRIGIILGSRAGTVGTSRVVCTNHSPGPLRLFNHTGTILRWESSEDNGRSWTPIAHTGTTYVPPPLTKETIYRVIVNDDICKKGEKASIGARIKVVPETKPGLVTTTLDKVCVGMENDVVLKAKDHAGNIIRWESSTDGGITWTAIQNISTTYFPGPLWKTTLFRPVIQAIGCAVEFSSSQMISIVPKPAAIGGKAKSTTLTNIKCQTTSRLWVEEHSNDVLEWEMKIVSDNEDCNTTSKPWIPVPTSKGKQEIVEIPCVTTCYRAKVRQSVCWDPKNPNIAYSTPVKIITIKGDDKCICKSEVCEGTSTTVSVSIPPNGQIVHWEYSNDYGVTWNVDPFQGLVYQTAPLFTPSCFRALVQVNDLRYYAHSCCIKIKPRGKRGQVTPNRAICSGENSGDLVLENSVGYIHRWEYSNDLTNWTAIPFTFEKNTYISLPLTRNTWYRAVVDSCDIKVYSDVAKIEVLPTPASNPGVLTANKRTVCPGGSTDLTLTDHVGVILYWERSIDNFRTSTTIRSTAESISTGPITSVTSFRAVVQHNVCKPSVSNTIKIEFDTEKNKGIITKDIDGVACANSNVTFTLENYTGSILRWESNTGGSQWTTINHISPSYTVPVPLRNTSYRVVLSGIECPISVTASVSSPVLRLPTLETSLMSPEVCLGDRTYVSVVGSATVLFWEWSTDNVVWNKVANTNTAYQTPPLFQNTYFRAYFKESECNTLVYSTPALVNMRTELNPGTITGQQKYCLNNTTNANVTLNLIGHNGRISALQEKLPHGWSDILFANKTPVTVQIRQNTEFRYIVEGCGKNDTTDVFKVELVKNTLEGGYLRSNVNETVCKGANVNLTLINHKGTILQWESSPNNFATPSAISTIAHTGTAFAVNNIQSTTFYRVQIVDAFCPFKVTSLGIKITVTDNNPINISISESQTICAGAFADYLDVSGNTSGILEWEESTNGMNWTKSTDLRFLYQKSYEFVQNPTISKQYRIKTYYAGCESSSYYSNAVNITVLDPFPIPGKVTGFTSVCKDINSFQLKLVGNRGQVQYWEQAKSDGLNCWYNAPSTRIAETETKLFIPTLAYSSCFRAFIKNGNCPIILETDFHNVQVTEPTIAGTILSSQNICASTSAEQLSLRGNVGKVLNWEESTDGVNWSVLNEKSNTLQPGQLNQTHYYRADVQNNGCAIETTNEVAIYVNHSALGGAVAPNELYACANSPVANLMLHNHSGNVIRWESSTNQGASWTPINHTLNNYNLSSVSQQTWIRAITTCDGGSEAASEPAKIRLNQRCDDCNGKTPPVFTTAITPASTPSQSDGQLVIMATKTAGLEFAINDGNFSANNVFSQLGEGSVKISVKDASGCMVSTEVNIPSRCPDRQVVFETQDTIFCLYHSPMTLSATPSDGQFSGPGMVGDVFHPAEAGVGRHSIVYRGGMGQCGFSATFHVNVYDATYPRIDGIPVYVNQNDPPYLVNPTPLGGTLFGPGIRGGYFHPNVAGVGEHMIFYNVHNDYCPTSGTFVVYVRPSITPCQAPTLRVERTMGNQATLRWNAVPGATVYRFEYRDNSNQSGPWISFTTTETFHILRLLVGKTYAFRVQAVCGSTLSRLSNTEVRYIFPIRMLSREGEIETGSIESNLLIYPNPTDGLFRLVYQNNSETTSPITVKICHVNGSEVYRETFSAIAGENHFTIDGSAFANGVYMVFSTIDNQTQITKMIKH